LRIGIPRVLNLYSLAPFFSAYLGSLGIPHRNLVFSDFTSEALYKEGAKRGAIDPCFPSKVAIAHLHNLMERKHRRKPLDWILFPKIASLPTPLRHTQDSTACPTATATPESVRAAFCKDEDHFTRLGIRLVSPFLSFAEPDLLKRQMWQTFGPLLRLSRGENQRACAAGWAALEQFGSELRDKGREILERLEGERRLGIVLLGRPYHNDPGRWTKRFWIPCSERRSTPAWCGTPARSATCGGTPIPRTATARSGRPNMWPAIHYSSAWSSPASSAATMRPSTT